MVIFMNEKIGLEILKGIIRNEQKCGRSGWELFISIDTLFITKHFGLIASNWAITQRDIEMTKLISQSQKNPNIKASIEAIQKIK